MTADYNKPNDDACAVDMVAQARATQLPDDAALRGFAKLVAPAKVNLHLAIGARRADGFHDVMTIMHALALHDIIYARVLPGVGAEGSLPAGGALAGPADNIEVRIETIPHGGVAPVDVPVAENLIFKAVDAMARELGRIEPMTMEFLVEKHIPAQGGLGGGSSDAAATAVWLAQYWGFAQDEPAFMDILKGLGSDVPFFVHGGCVCLTGRGDVLHRRLVPMKGHVVLVKPDGGVNTGLAYKTFDECAAEAPVVDAATEACDEVLACESAECVTPSNNLAFASEAIMPELTEVREWLAAQPGSKGALLCGSGATTFAIVESLEDSLRIAAAAQARGWWSRSTTLCGLRAAVVPRS